MKKLQLKEEHVQHLITLPENGMGYQVVDITLRSGNILKKRVVLNSNLLLLEANEDIDPNSIERIELTKSNASKA